MVAGLIISIHAPRAGGDDLRVRSGHRMGISIHAHHAGGDLQILRPKGLDDRISIHAPMRGATPIFDKSIKQLAFQSTPPCGGRHDMSNDAVTNHSISIHAPVRGATYDM